MLVSAGSEFGYLMDVGVVKMSFGLWVRDMILVVVSGKIKCGKVD